MRRSLVAVIALVASGALACVGAQPVVPAPAPATPVTIAAPAPAPRVAAEEPPPRVTPDAPFRRTAPPAEPAPAFVTPPVRDLRLSNGVRVLLLEKHVPSLVGVRLVVRAPAGISDATLLLLAHTLDASTSTRSNADIGRALNDAGAYDGEGYDGEGTIDVGLTAPAAHLEAAVDLLADMALRPTFDAASVERVRDFRAAGIERDDVATTPAHRVLPMAMLGVDRPVHGWLRPDDLRAVTPADVARAHASAFDPRAATIVVAGDTTEDVARPLLERAFGAWSASGKRLGPRRAMARFARGGARLVLVDRPGAAQSTILVGAAGPSRGSAAFHPSYLAAMLLAEGDGELQATLRDDMRVAHSLEWGFTYLTASTIAYWETAVPIDRTADALRAVDRRITALRDGEIPVPALEDVRARLLAHEPQWFRTIAGMASTVGMVPYFGLPTSELVTRMDRFRATTAAEVQRAAKAMLDPATLKIVVVGDLGALATQLAALGWSVERRDEWGKRAKDAFARPRSAP